MLLFIVRLSGNFKQDVDICWFFNIESGKSDS